MRKNEQGFTILEGVLFLVIIAIIGLAGAYVWHTNKQADEDLQQSASAPVITLPSSAVQPKDETANWLLYTTPGNEYSIRLADGWKLVRYMNDSFLYTRGTKDIQYKPGTKAVVTQVDGGSDGSSEGLFIGYSRKDYGFPAQGSSVTGFTTNDGLAVTKYYYVEPGKAEASIGGLAGGGKQYVYRLHSGTRYMEISYGLEPGAIADTATVEKAIKSIHLL